MSDDITGTPRHTHRAQLREVVAREVGDVVKHLASTIETAAFEQAEAVAHALVTKAREIAERQGREIERLLQEVTVLRGEVERLKASRHRLAVTLERELRDVRPELDVQTAEVARANQLSSDSVAVEEGPRGATVTPIRGTADSILLESASLVLNEVESRYFADVQSGLEPAQLVERLTSHLEHARSMYARCLESVGAQDAHAFEHELARLIDRHGSAAFGRHLAVASYADQQRAAAPRAFSARAS